MRRGMAEAGITDVKATIRNGEVRVSCHAYNAPADVVLAASMLEPLMATCDLAAARSTKRQET